MIVYGKPLMLCRLTCSCLEKRRKDFWQLRGQDRLVDKLVLRFSEFVSIRPRVPRVPESFFLNDRESRRLGLLEVVEGGAISVIIGVMRHCLFRIEVAVFGEEDEGVENPYTSAFETRQTHYRHLLF